MSETQITWKEMMRFATPILLIVVNVCIGMVLSNQTDIKAVVHNVDDKLFKHLTNDEMHGPRSLMVTKPEFSLFQAMGDAQMKDIRDAIYDVKMMLKDHDKKTS